MHKTKKSAFSLSSDEREEIIEKLDIKLGLLFDNYVNENRDIICGSSDELSQQRRIKVAKYNILDPPWRAHYAAYKVPKEFAVKHAPECGPYSI